MIRIVLALALLSISSAAHAQEKPLKSMPAGSSEAFKFSNKIKIAKPSYIDEMEATDLDKDYFVFQVVDESNAIVKFHHLMYWYSGSTKGWIDKSNVPIARRVLRQGTRTYETALGALKTIPVLRDLTSKELEVEKKAKAEIEAKLKRAVEVAKPKFDAFFKGLPKVTLKLGSGKVIVRRGNLVGFAKAVGYHGTEHYGLFHVFAKTKKMYYRIDIRDLDKRSLKSLEKPMQEYVALSSKVGISQTECGDPVLNSKSFVSKPYPRKDTPLSKYFVFELPIQKPNK